MEHEVFVPVPAETVRQTLTDPGRVARCVPGLQRDADASAGPLAGRLKFRVGGHTITYRGALRITEQDGGFAVEGEGTEARGPGAAKLTLTLRLTPAEGGTTISFSGTSHAEGRLAELPPETTAQAATRLLDRFAASMASLVTQERTPGSAEQADSGPTAGPAAEEGRADGDARTGGEADGRESAPVGAGAEPEPGAAPDSAPAGKAEQDAEDEAADGEVLDLPAQHDAGAGDAATGPGAESGEADGASARADEAVEEASAREAEGYAHAADGDDGRSVFDVDVPPSALDPMDGEEFDEDEEPPAEAAHARRTMIGRSAEEVDHAPPRGRYAPVPAPQATSAGGTLRWIAPAAALAIASAVVVGRALRRRR
ncbi:SRPBCC domain-containing protein [Streptomyces sp. NPDC057445]|uniref:SRPBCC domain-containing protein n=1 Tax=Streptomyces sp. NPDC057445 TaxID=3346136 RepID=UPI0036AF1BA4